MFYEFLLENRKIIYSSNLIENLNGKIRKCTENKLSFLIADAVMFPIDIETVYLPVREAAQKRTMSVRNWDVILNQFLTTYETRADFKKPNSCYFKRTYLEE